MWPIFRGTVDSRLDNEGYAEYVAWLDDAVTKIADAEPDRAEVLNALLGLGPGPGDTAYGRWLGTHGDKALPYLLRYVADHRSDERDSTNRTDALECLAQIAAYERKSDSVHRLSANDLQMVEELVRNAADDSDRLVRRAGIIGLGIMGDPDDLATIDSIALTDPYVVTNGGPTGADIRFPLRELAATPRKTCAPGSRGLRDIKVSSLRIPMSARLVAGRAAVLG